MEFSLNVEHNKSNGPIERDSSDYKCYTHFSLHGLHTVYGHNIVRHWGFDLSYLPLTGLLVEDVFIGLPNAVLFVGSDFCFHSRDEVLMVINNPQLVAAL